MAILTPKAATKYPHLAGAVNTPAATNTGTTTPAANTPTVQHNLAGMYQDMFGRAADLEGLGYWEQQAGNYATDTAMRQALLNGATAADKAAYYGRVAGTPTTPNTPSTPAPTTPNLGEMLDPFAQMFASMNESYGQQQAGYQDSLNSLMEAWAGMATPQSQTPAANTPTNPYAQNDGVGQVSAVYSPTGQNGLNFGWGGSNPFAATF